MIASPFLLKTAPPRLGRALFTRPRLEQRWAEVSDRAAILVTAPQGFGKTILLAQWRRRWLERGAFVAWVSLDARDDRSQFVDLLLFALRDATGRDSFATAALQGRLQENRELEALTALLAEVAALATPTVIVLDDAHRMPQEALRELLSYLLYNAPPNLQFLVGSRRPLELQFSDLMAAGRFASINASDLRLSLEESVQFLQGRFGPRIGMDEAVRIHELTEGWPLGLQLAAATIERASDAHAMVRKLSARRGDIQRFFFETLLSQRSEEEAGFLVRISILESVSASLCEAVTALPEAARILERVVRTSPVMTEGEDREWIRLHAMARDFLLGQFDKLPVEERRSCYERAAAWYAANGQFQEAARHAWAAGNESLAVDYAAACLRDIAREGRLGEAHDWMRRLPTSVISRDVRLQLTAAWIQAMGHGAATVPAVIEQVRRHPQFDELCAFEAALISATAATFCDKPGLIEDALRGLADPPPGATPLHLLSLGNQQGILALLAGSTERARQILSAAISAAPREPLMRLSLGFADFMLGLTHLWEGNPARAIAVFEPQLRAAEREMGRRSTVAVMLAAGHAAALYLQDSVDMALSVLADRLDVIERVGLPDPIVLAYRVLAETAARRGDERRALDTWQSLHEIGMARELPRLVSASLAGQIRIHLMGARVETAAELVEAMAALRPAVERPECRIFLGMYERRLAVARASVLLSKLDPAGAEAVLAPVNDVPPWLRCNPDVLSYRALRALAAHARGQPGALEQLNEVMSLAELRGMRRLVEEAHPGLAAVLGPAAAVRRDEPETRSAADVRAATALTGEAAASSGLLTPKEAQILSLLASGMANKEIARAMDIGEQTVKWHLKNVFFKLNAASRRHAVDRARVLGLLSA
jgi:LuxR family maltose regulon positive regulatory protein